jgi:serine/threonine protein kinase
MLQREASRQQRLAHPNIVTVYDFDRTGDTIFISMELLEGTRRSTSISAPMAVTAACPWRKRSR